MHHRLTIGIVAFTFLAIWVPVSSSDRNVNRSAQPVHHPTPEPEQDKSSFPVVRYSQQIEKVHEKSRKYEKLTPVLSDEISKNIDSLSGVRWYIGLPALPEKASSIILKGTVDAVQANIPSSRNTVYTTIGIRINKVFKNKSGQELGSHIEAEREGGVVLYVSGFTLWHRLPGQKMPKVDHDYVFFLTEEFPLIGDVKGNYYLVTAYELGNDGIQPLDNPGETHAIVSKYRGRPNSDLLNDLKALLKE